MKYLMSGLAALLLGAGLSLAPTASAGPYCDFFDVFGICDVRDAVKLCNEYPQECEEYFDESTPTRQYSPPTQQPYYGDGE
ncbi:hypothetical protein [Mycolicibacterium goodii]|uniref:DUF3551 domain-containing protein n=1 Tax=Mycolicibacterium goodii TaxID=134601 RepID=A0ABS6HWC9_MYCGD|nr:hypothetical protein [Mycolicibacterium goodii]MBU8820982.1 hypothetical protein [Mycolicibacterium goodii]MBU8826979.1 hypothetical protein [Mycolicibacterium goodii]MBU8840498.1 hypothetical protein [Mycolicibacterium goodii]